MAKQTLWRRAGCLLTCGLAFGSFGNTVPDEGQIRSGELVRFEGEGLDGGLLVVGSSYAWHGPNERSLGWKGDWGMAASAREKDCAHLLWAALRKSDPKMPLCIAQSAHWERNYTNDIALLEADFAALSKLRPKWICFVTTAGNSDLAANERVPVAPYYIRMVEWFRRLNPEARVVLSTTGRLKGLAEAVRAYGVEKGYPVVDHDFLDDLSGGYRAYGLFRHPGVAWHPSDKGFEEMAHRYLKAWGLGDDPTSLSFKLAAVRRFQLDATIPFEQGTFYPGAQYTARVTVLPAAVRFAEADGRTLFRYELSADDTRLPSVPFDLSLLVAGRSCICTYTGRGKTARLLDLVPTGEDFDPCAAEHTKSVRFEAEGGAVSPQGYLSAGIGQADIRFVTEGRENRPYVENGRLFFTFSARSIGSWLGVMSIDPKEPSDLRLEGSIFFDYGDGLVRNDLAADLFHDTESGVWRAYVSNFSTAAARGSGKSQKRVVGGVNVAWCVDCPLHGAHVMKAKSLGLPGMNEDPDGIWDAEAGKWRLLLSEFTPAGIRASMWESASWDGPFVRLTPPVKADSTGTTVFPFKGRRYCLSGSVDRACYVYSYPMLEPIGRLSFDHPPWPEKKGWPHGRVWPAVAEVAGEGGRQCLMVTMDRENFQGMPKPNWTYGTLMVYVADSP